MIDFSSATWKSLNDYLIIELQKLREKNDNIKLSIEETAAIRGRIVQIQELLSLPRKEAANAKMAIPSQSEY
jgi:hypothetical protein